MIEFRALGPAQLEGPTGTDPQAVLARPKVLGVLAFLAAARGFQRRDSLIGCFWPDLSQERARSAVRQSLYRLRRALGEAVVVSRGDDEVALSDEGFWSDIGAFEEALARGDRAAALELYRGDLLEGFYVPDAPEFERWLDERRKELRRRAAAAAWELADQEAGRRNTGEAGRWGRQARRLAPLDEGLLRRVISLLDGLGDRAGAVREYETFARRLAQELELEPSPESKALVASVRRRDGPPAPPPARTPPRISAEPEADVAAELAGRYRLGPEIGTGGMATVYRARDLRHERDVAVKVMHTDLAVHAATDRFLREIKIAANLTHPHIVPVYDSGTAGGRLYFVMPLIQGESLRERLRREGPLSPEDAIGYGLDVAEALAHAHDHGVVHRDVKPENVLLSGGNALVTDFGIARAIGVTGDARLTGAGAVVGTPAYMSPEQASGGEVDHRSDLYSLGCVLYEMMAGRPPFTGTNPQAVLSAHVVERPRALKDVRPTVPLRLSQAVMRCLEKTASDRWNTANEVLAELQACTTPTGGQAPTVKVRPSRRTLTIVTAGVIVVAAALVVATLRTSTGPVAPPAPRHTQLTFSGDVLQSEISPDGQLLAYVEAGDPARLFVKDVAGGTVIEVAAMGTASSLRWSPDGAALLFAGFDSAGQYTVVTYPRLGGPPRPLPGVAAYVVWAPDGSRVAHWWQGPRDGANPIRLTTLATHDTGSLATPDSVGTFLLSGDWSPSDRFVALASQSASSYGLWTVALDGSGWRRLILDTLLMAGPRWSPAGDAVYYLRGDELRKVRVGPDGRARGGPEVLLAGLEANRGMYDPAMSLTADGRALVFTKTQRHSNLWLTTADGATVQLTHGTASRSHPRLSPDGQWIAYVQRTATGPGRGGGGDVYLVPVAGGTPRRVTSRGEAVTGAVWSPDGSAVAFGVRSDGAVRVQRMSLDEGQITVYRGSEMGENGLAWAPGRRIAYSSPSDRNFSLLDPDTGAETALLPNEAVGWAGFPYYSPDGRRVAFFWNRTDQRDLAGVWVASLDESTRVLVYPGRANPVGWTADGRSVYVREHDGDDVLLMQVPEGQGIVAATVPFEGAAECTPVERAGGPAWLCSVVEAVSDAWMVENFDPEYASVENQ